MTSNDKDLDTQIVLTCFADMTRRGYFDICAFRKCVEIMRVVVPRNISDRLEALHCVHFKDMPADVIAFVESSCLKLFELPQLHLIPQKRRWLIG
jgi:hypothetical protein